MHRHFKLVLLISNFRPSGGNFTKVNSRSYPTAHLISPCSESLLYVSLLPDQLAVFQGGGIYSYANFCCYAYFLLHGPKILGGTKFFQGWASSLNWDPLRLPPMWKKGHLKFVCGKLSISHSFLLYIGSSSHFVHNSTKVYETGHCLYLVLAVSFISHGRFASDQLLRKFFDRICKNYFGYISDLFVENFT